MMGYVELSVHAEDRSKMLYYLLSDVLVVWIKMDGHGPQESYQQDQG
jgi:hypothetical protein